MTAWGDSPLPLPPEYAPVTSPDLETTLDVGETP